MARSVRSLTKAALVAALLLAGIVAAGAGPAGATTPGCRVKNATQGGWYASQGGQALTTAIDRAATGNRLNVFGRCRGNFAIDKDLSVFGTTNELDPTVLDGGGAGTVLSVNERVTVTLTRLTITGGNATVRVGGGIQTGGILTLNASKVVGNRATLDGGGIYNYGDLTLHRTVVSRNQAGGGGGGIFSEGTAVLNFSTVTRNAAGFGGGILSVNTLELNGTVVSGNTPDDCSC